MLTVSLADCVTGLVLVMAALGACGLYATRKGRKGSDR
jgi:hypothetical protein